MKKTNRAARLALLLAAVFAFFGCGAGEAEGGEPASSGGTRTAEHGLGETEVPENLERVVTFLSAADVALAVGVEPVAVDDETAQFEYLTDRLEGVETFGSISEPYLEKIATLEPDLIIGPDVVVEQVYDELSQIAPTVGVEFGEAKAQDFQEAMNDRLGETEVATMRASPENLRFDLPGIFIGDVTYNDTGLPIPPGPREPAENPEDYTLEISKEQFGLAEGSDALFVWNVTGEPEKDEREIAEVTNDPLFRRLEAVRNGNVYTMDGHWFSESVLGADMVFDDLDEERLLRGSDS